MKKKIITILGIALIMSVLFTTMISAAGEGIIFDEGYPYKTGGSSNGSYVVVKTNVSGYIYVVAMPDDIVGGISGRTQLIEYYNADNGLYKTIHYVQAGIETKIPISCSSSSNGGDYRAYICAYANGYYTEFYEVKYITTVIPTATPVVTATTAPTTAPTSTPTATPLTTG